ncbi:MAG: NAD(P)/FAD-dependent oxidoreductase [Lachnospiraceae bacterium]|nr:NAD(P)/FAD-dependent oxidoreductase [Lachnospiraceae bacterium]MDD3660677.1 NAD(P)/FAD-dependent oxidoreductase [Lachnospiraceae bacterium]
MKDVVIIGAGVTGCAIARELSKYKLDICVLDKEEDVCCGTSKANSAIIHAGFDAEYGSLMAKMNVRGNKMMDQLVKDLDIPYLKNGAFVACSNPGDEAKLKALLERGRQNGVEGMTILSREEAVRMEPNLSEDVTSVVYAPSSGIICPFTLTIALAENAAENGVSFQFETTVNQIDRTEEGFLIQTDKGELVSKCVINAAGVFADEIHNMLSQNKMKIIPRRGDYFLLDKAAGKHVGKTIFSLPGKYGKGVLVAPTIHGNLIVGPTAIDIEDKEGTNTTVEGLEMIKMKAGQSVKNLPLNQVITSFSGLRAHEEHHEFIIEEVSDVPGLVDVAGIESPGLSSAPAIAELVGDLVRKILPLEQKEDFVATRKGILNPEEYSLEERNELIRQNPAYGKIVCRCEMITEGEILDAIHRPVGARSLDGIKRRARAGSGRCQAGFCTPKLMEILSRECEIPMEQVTKSGKESRLVTGRTK